MNIFDDLKESVSNFFRDITTTYETSKKWKEFRLGLTLTHCLYCLKKQNKIFSHDNLPELPIHEHCACLLVWLRKLPVGKATKLGINGADYFLHNFNSLPNYYITKEQALSLGWKPWIGNLKEVAPGKMIGGNIFYNRADKLPHKEGRIWYECDIDYNGGYRNNYRLIYSNDGLIFRTDNHYSSFVEIS